MFYPENMTLTGGSFVFSGAVTAAAPACLDNESIRMFWQGFTRRCSALQVQVTDGFCFRIGEAEALPADPGSCSIHVTETGLCIAAENEKNLLMGFMTLLDRIETVDDENGATVLSIPCCRLFETPGVGLRMVHFCVFPETTLWQLQKFLRFCAALRYSHVVVEFWGMYKFECMPELGWPQAFTKEQLTPVFAEARELGLELVPMFNHWGHASGSRGLHGKHVVLDQNPALETYFCANGWCWDIRKPKVRALMRQVRRELCEVCGAGSYFHIGCDEADGFDLETEDGMNAVCDYLNEIADDLETQGRRAIAWGDMFLYRHAHYDARNVYTANAPAPRTEEYMLNRLSRKIVIADWQYDANYAPVETAAVFTRAGFDCMLCPWDRSIENTRACLATAKQDKLFGLIHTTWHTLSSRMAWVAAAATGCFEKDTALRHTATAAILRKADFVNGDYEKAGWATEQINVATFF